MSLLVVGSPCHPWLSRLLVALTGEGGTRENLIRPDSRVDRGAKGAQSQSLKVSRSPGRPVPFQPVSRGPVNRHRSLTTKPRRPHPTAVLPGRAFSRPAAPVRGARRRQAARNPKLNILPSPVSRFAIRDFHYLSLLPPTPPKSVNFCQLL